MTRVIEVVLWWLEGAKYFLNSFSSQPIEIIALASRT